MKYMLDTNTCIAIIKKAPSQLKDKLKKISLDDVGVSSIVIAELWYGIEQSQSIVLNNTVSNFAFGLNNHGGIYTHNTVYNCTTNYTGGTAGAGNSP